MNKTATVLYAVTANEDQTEGKGKSYTAAVAPMESTALRLAKGKGVQGTDAMVKPFFVYLHEDSLYVPYWVLNIEQPTAVDRHEQGLLEARRVALQKIKDAGVTNEELRLLGLRDEA